MAETTKHSDEKALNNLRGVDAQKNASLIGGTRKLTRSKKKRGV